MEIREGKLLDETHGSFVVRVGLARKPGDDVRAQADAGHGLGQLQRPGSVRFACMPSLHSTQDRIGTALHWHVYMWGNAATRGANEVDEQLVDLRCLDAPYTKPDVRNGVQELGQKH